VALRAAWNSSPASIIALSFAIGAPAMVKATEPAKAKVETCWTPHKKAECVVAYSVSREEGFTRHTVGSWFSAYLFRNRCTLSGDVLKTVGSVSLSGPQPVRPKVVGGSLLRSSESWFRDLGIGRALTGPSRQ
jgi:hypothetical protein